MKKVLSIAALCLIGILAGTIIVFSCVNKDFNLNLTNPDSISVYINKSLTENSEAYSLDSDDAHKEIYNKILALYNDSFKQKMMSAFFNGTLNEGVTITRESRNLSSLTNTGTWLVFDYNLNPQTIRLNGKDYKDDSSSSKEYDKVFVEVKNSETMTTFTIYLAKRESNYSYYHYTARAKQCDLYNYLNDDLAK